MTRDEAILRLEVLKDFSHKNELKNIHEAIDVAIEALERERVGEWVRTEVGSEKPWKCSECGYQPVHYSTQVKPYEHYCGECGTYMREGERNKYARI